MAIGQKRQIGLNHSRNFDHRRKARKTALAPEVEEKKAQFITETTAQGIEAGLTPEAAQEMAEQSVRLILLSGCLVWFVELGKWVNIKDILANPAKYDEMACYDPLEGKEYGHPTGIFYANNRCIHSFACHERNFYLKYDYALMEELIEKGEPTKADDILYKLKPDAALSPSQLSKLIALASGRSKATKTSIKDTLARIRRIGTQLRRKDSDSANIISMLFWIE